MKITNDSKRTTDNPIIIIFNFNHYHQAKQTGRQTVSFHFFLSAFEHCKLQSVQLLLLEHLFSSANADRAEYAPHYFHVHVASLCRVG